MREYRIFSSISSNNNYVRIKKNKDKGEYVCYNTTKDEQ